eukprot:scaffold649_cov347-Pavlova_lutheri.AAC.120
MAHVLGKFATVRENGYFKRENEAEIQAWRETMIKEGRMTEEEAKAAKPKKKRWEKDDGRSLVLMEILQQETRINAPEAWREKNVERRGCSEAPGPSKQHAMQAYRELYGGALSSISATMAAPGLSYARHGNSWNAVREASRENAQVQSAAHKAAVMERQAKAAAAMVGARAVLYGTMAALVGVAAAVTLCVHWADDLPRMKASLSSFHEGEEHASPMLRSIREKVFSLQTHFNNSAEANEGGLRQRLRDRFRIE